MATEMRDTPRFNAASIVSQVTKGDSSLAYVPMSAIGGAYNWYEAWSITDLTVSSGNTTLSAMETTTATVAKTVATLIAQLIRRGILPTGTVSGF